MRLLVNHDDLARIDVVEALSLVLLNEDEVISHVGLTFEELGELTEEIETKVRQEHNFLEHSAPQLQLNLVSEALVDEVEYVSLFYLDIFFGLKNVVEVPSNFHSKLVRHVLVGHESIHVHHFLSVLTLGVVEATHNVTNAIYCVGEDSTARNDKNHDDCHLTLGNGGDVSVPHPNHRCKGPVHTSDVLSEDVCVE